MSEPRPVGAADATPTSSRRRWARYGIEGAPARSLRVGIFIDDMHRVPAWVADALDLLIDSSVAEAIAITFPSPEQGQPAIGTGGAAARFTRAAMWRSAPAASIALPSRLDRVERLALSLLPIADGAWQLTEASVGDLTKLQMDVLLDLSRAGIEPAGGVARHGTWRVRVGAHGSTARTPAFWELLDGASELVVVLERAHHPSGVEVLRRAALPIERHSYRATLERAYRCAAEMPLIGCRDLLIGGDPAGTPVPRDPATPRIPGATTTARLALTIAVAGLARALYGAFVLKQWSIGRLEGGARRVLSGNLQGARWMTPPGRTGIIADPVAVPGTDGGVVLAEFLDQAASHGVIVRFEVDAAVRSTDSVLQVGSQRLVAIDRLHLSYPSVTVVAGGLVMIPEAAGSRGLLAIDLDAGAASVRSMSHRPGLAALDPTPFWFDSRWWLACAEDGWRSSSHLWLFHAADPHGPWMAHRRNPVVIDAGAARPAGAPFLVDGRLYRPAQDLRAGYGRAVNVMRVLTLTPDAYEEEHAVRLEPDPNSPFARGIHTVSVDGGGIWIDGYRTVVHPLAGWFRLRARSRAPAMASLDDGGWPS